MEPQITGLEARLRQIYCNVLGLESIAPTDNILDLGGHSIPIMTIVAMTRKELGVELSVKEVFRAPTVAELALLLAPRLAPTVAEQKPTDELTCLDPQALAQWRAVYPNLANVYPISAMQLGLLFHSMLARSQFAYSNQVYCTLPGSLDVAAFKRAWSMVIARHAILRTAFVGMDLEQPLQLVVTEVPLPWRDLALRELPDAQLEARFQQLRREDKERAFEFGRPGLLRFMLIRASEMAYRFIWTYHHSLLDGWSESLVWDEVWRAYGALCVGENPVFPQSSGYSEYVRWVQRQDRKAALAYWRKHLGAVDRPTQLGIERQGASVVEEGPAELRWAATLEQTQRLTRAARSHRVTLFTLVEAAWAWVLHSYSGADSVIFGITVSGRAIDLPGVESIVGVLINTLPTRVAIDSQRPLGEWLRSIHDEQLDQEANAHVPLSEIQGCTRVKPGTALFDTLILFESYPGAAAMSAPALAVSDYGNDEQTHYGLTLQVLPGKTLSFNLGFDARRFRRKDVEAVREKFAAVLQRFTVASGDSSVSECLAPACKPVAAHKSYDSDVMTRGPLSKACRQGELRLGRSLVHQLIEDQAAAHPNRMALRYNAVTCTYDELNRAANRIAHYLLDSCAGLRADSVIAVMLPRGDQLLLSILAIWKAGAAYVPIDPTLPGARIRSMLHNCAALLVLTQRDALNRYPCAEWGIPALALETIADQAEAAEDDPNVNVSGSDLSYIIYTSGSTGIPKGAMVEHIGMLNNIANKVIDFEIDAESRVAQTASASFDISVWQMFIALTQGAMTVIYDDRTINDIGRYLERLHADGVTLVEMVPSYLTLLLEYLGERALEYPGVALRWLVLTGERADAGPIRQWCRHFPNTKVANAYGPTEASDDITHYLMSPGDEVTDPVPLGRVLANFDLYVVDEQLNPVPPGVQGEIVVTGVGVGRGYINLPEATARAFLQSPFRDKYRGRLYRTGDVGEMRPDGLLLFHGRKDRQVKIRGFRIELEEVEVRVAELESVRQAVVLDISPAGREPFMCAFVVPQGTPDKQAFIEQLQQQLPGYMVPTEVRFLEALPHLPNGKIDRKSLREQYSQAPEQARSHHEPTTETESRLLRLWREVLRLEWLGIDDDFFAVGGDSFKAIRIAAKYGPGLEVADLYDLKTVRALARTLDQSVLEGERRIVTLASRPGAKVAVLGIPNSAGDPVNFFELGRELVALGEEVALYATKLPRIPVEGEGGMLAEIQRLTEELCEVIAAQISLPLVIFGQCNGSALAISLARRLQQLGSPPRALCIGGALLRTRMTPPDGRDDEQIEGFLRSIGASLPAEPDELAFFLNDFRYDGELADCYYNSLVTAMSAREVEPLDTPICCIVGSEDPLVRGYRQRFRDWERLSRQVRLVEFPSRGHFLLRDCPRELAAVVRQACLAEAQARAVARSAG